MTLDEVKQNLERYKQRVHQGNRTAQNYVEAVELLLDLLNASTSAPEGVEQKHEDQEPHRATMYTYKYPHPAVTADVAVFRRNHDPTKHEVLLIKRGCEPYLGYWALPGGHAEPNEELVATAARELKEEAGLTDKDYEYLEEARTYSTPGRDPRGWYITVVYVTTVPEGTQATAGDDAKEVQWFPMDQLPSLAFDHAKILTNLGCKCK